MQSFEDQEKTQIVSVLLRTKNGAAMVEDCVKSIREQERKAIQLIVLDYGSVDNTVETIKGLFGEITLVRQTDDEFLPFSVLLSDIVKGEYIATIDQGDEWYPNKVANQVDFLNKNPSIGMLCSNMHLITQSQSAENFSYVPADKCFTPGWEDLLFKHPVAYSSCVFRSSVLRKIDNIDRVLDIATIGFDSAALYVAYAEKSAVFFQNAFLGRTSINGYSSADALGQWKAIQKFANLELHNPVLEKDEGLRAEFSSALVVHAISILKHLSESAAQGLNKETLRGMQSLNQSLRRLFKSAFQPIVEIGPIASSLGRNFQPFEVHILHLYSISDHLQKAFPEVRFGDFERITAWDMKHNDGIIHARFGVVTKPNTGARRAMLERFQILWRKGVWVLRRSYRIAKTEGLGRFLSKIGIRLLSLGQKKPSSRAPVFSKPDGSNCPVEQSESERILTNEDILIPFPIFDTASLLIIVDVSSNPETLVACFNAIRAHTNCSYKIVAVDNTFSVKTKLVLDRVRNAVVLNNFNWDADEGQTARRYVEKADYVLRISACCVPGENYLEPLFKTFQKQKNCGAVVPKIVTTSGELCSAGILDFTETGVAHYGSGDRASRPEYSFVRSLANLSRDAVCLEMSIVRSFFTEPSKALEELSRFDVRKLSSWFGNTEHLILFQPESVIYQKRAIHDKPENSRTLSTLHKRHVGTSLRILVLDNYIPAVRLGAGYPRSKKLLQTLASLGEAVTFFPVGNPDKIEPDTYDLQQTGIEVFWGSEPNFEDFVKERSRYYDLVIVSRPHVFSRVSELVRNQFPNARLIYDAEALFYTRDLLRAKMNGQMITEDQKNKLAASELDLVKKADLTIAVSEQAMAMMIQNNPEARVRVWGHVQDVNESIQQFEEREGILFLGSFFAGPGSPNEDAALYFARDVFPTIQQHIGCKLFIVGTQPTDAVRALASDNIIVTGFVSDIKEYVDMCRVNVVPTRLAAVGIPLKLIEVLSYGLPSVLTPMMASQLHVTANNQVLVGNDALSFAEEVVRLYSNEALWNKLKSASLEHVRNNYSTEIMSRKIREIIDAAFADSVIEH